MECNSRCFDPCKDSVRFTLCKKPYLSAGSDVRNLLSSLRKSPNFAGLLKSSFQSSWFGAKEGMNLVRLAATCHSCTSTPVLFSRNCVSSRSGRVSATETWTLRRENSAQQGVSSLPLHAQSIACSLRSGGEGGSQKQNRVSACQIHRIYSVSVCTRKLTRGVLADELHMFSQVKLHCMCPRQRTVSRAHST